MSCKRHTQFAVNGTLSLPKHTPDIDFILRATSTPIIRKTIILDKQISFSGYVNICIEFVSSNFSSTQTVHFVSFEAPFTAIINHCHAKAGMDCQLKACIKHQDFQLVDNRCINKLIVIKVSILKLSNSCNHTNCHCSESSMTLLCTPEKIKSCRNVHSTTSGDELHDISAFNNFHTPTSQQLEPTDISNYCSDHENLSSYLTCEGEASLE